MLSTLYDQDFRAVDDFSTSAYAAADVRALERPLLDNGVPLMRMAATATARAAQAMLARAMVEPDEAQVVLLAGGGDNGGDGLFAAAELAGKGAHVTVVAVGHALHKEGYAALRQAGCATIALDPRADIPGVDAPTDDEEAAERFDDAIAACQEAHIILDAMTGIGLKGALRGIPARIAAELGEDGALPADAALPRGATTDGFPKVLAVDIPSGVGVDDGTLPGAYIPADVTVTFGALKPCALLPPASHACGRLVLLDFGFDTDGADVTPAVHAMSMPATARLLRLPQVEDAKYSRGVVGLVTGSDAYPGAAVLTSRAAAGTNVGMVRYVGPARAEDLVLRSLPEAVMGAGHVQSWVVGSGVATGEADAAADRHDGQRDAIARLLAAYDLDTTDPDDDAPAPEALPPVVVDAGALDLLPGHVPPQVLVTPHAGEAARLLDEREGTGIETGDVMAEPARWAARIHELTGATVLLKGAVTVIAGTDQSTAGLDGTDEDESEINETHTRMLTAGRGPAWLATAGAGDVLAGIIGALLAQHADDIADNPSIMADLAAAGAYLHGLAAAFASHSLQYGWPRPAVVEPDEGPEAFLHALRPTRHSEDDADAATVGTLGHPITASRIINALDDALGMVVALNDDADDGDDTEAGELFDEWIAG